MMKLISAFAALGLIAGCASSVPYGPAASGGDKGYLVQSIENNRYRVSYTDNDAETARMRALRRAAEVTLEADAEWFRVVSSYDDAEASRSGGSSISIGGSSGSYGSGVGVGLGIGFPIGGSSGPATHVIEIVTGSSDKPADAEIYDANDVLMNLAAS